ncbi:MULTISPECIES: hypothetical protein [Aneurinibacillus]|uniref:Uncharacterized protein n=1 Tax=Aneurinibacillus thermoaerophilus TaxID=143495 RepID=A0A1G8A791_ANETH|nr:MULTISPECIES: hypothetical protein [Aneurinibacillus]AMA74075.1 hypothetical protein ACH33_15450 [Aneurinibacillus sp. XH2]MED0675448.1 hypothetical protein [Aneurinibacillus thermoaerophilus]MED0678802.1 hypothetical protein [Aneurinibacillus thermoaerophilus]MED0736676.1 hypothetical protein [Aneurinibacillus thermoaerophilus]MED0758330.1 hypothetical protein [Aneurinibacillus thermoaerophilus]
MYPFEEVLAWEAEMNDSLYQERKILAAYQWMKMDLNDRRAALLQENTIDGIALDQLDQALLHVEELIMERYIIIDEKEKAVERMYQQWQHILQNMQ